MTSFRWVTFAALVSFGAAALVWSATTNSSTGSHLGISTLSNPATPGSIAPNLTKAPGDRVILSWLEPSGSALVLKFAVRDGDSWGPTHRVIARQNFDRYAEAPPWVTMFDNGTLIAVWGEEFPTGGRWPGSYLYTAVSRDGGKVWSQPHTIHSDRSKSEHSFASVAPRTADSVLVIWLDARDDASQHRYHLMSREIDSSGVARNERMIDDDVCTCCPTSLARMGSDIFAAYRDHTSQDIRDIGVAREHDGSWIQPAIIHPDGWHINACPVNGPALTVDGDSLIAAWYTAANGKPAVNLALSRDLGKSFLALTEVDRLLDVDKPIGRVAIASLSNHHILLAWLHDHDGASELLAAASALDRPVSKPSIVGHGNSRSLGYPRIQALGNSAILSWGGSGDEKIVRTALISQF